MIRKVLVLLSLQLVASITPIACLAESGNEAGVSLTINLTAYHYNRKKDYNEDNFGLGLNYQTEPGSQWNVGYYKNSFRRHSNYLYRSWLPCRLGETARVGGFVGVVNGYQAVKAMPALGLQGQVDFGRFRLNMVFTPTIKPKISGFAALQLMVDVE